MLREKKGITLIALVITIVVLLILAGVTIATLTGENGILTQAGKAKVETDKASALEAVQLEVIGSMDTYGELDMDKVSNNVSKNLGATSTGYGDDLVVDYANYKFLVDTDGNVTFFDNSIETIANAPKLSSGMIPVKFDTSKTENGNNGEWVICSSTDPDWYSYTTDDKRWAIVMLFD